MTSPISALLGGLASLASCTITMASLCFEIDLRRGTNWPNLTVNLQKRAKNWEAVPVTCCDVSGSSFKGQKNDPSQVQILLVINAKRFYQFFTVSTTSVLPPTQTVLDWHWGIVTRLFYRGVKCCRERKSSSRNSLFFKNGAIQNSCHFVKFWISFLAFNDFYILISW